MNIFIAFAIASAVYAGAAALLCRSRYKIQKSDPFWGIDTSTKKGRQQFMAVVKRRHEEAMEQEKIHLTLRDGIE